ncbi:mesaconyl-C4 CoA hydratase [Apiospora saccharicola]|uniref:Mesaconyl-C4 CoA hydratase n=1 Tax=Apiospora saccharicola TaxID=335842 RepID=A0ABR1WD55_9PEZI
MPPPPRPRPQPPLDIENLRAEMLARPEQLTYDALTNIPSHLFDISLSEPIPPPLPHLRRPPTRPPPHPLPPRPAPSRLCPDGTDPYHSPGEPFERRMWAGGSIEFLNILRQNRTPYVCAETIQDVRVRGPPGDEKVFVDVLRRYGKSRQVRDDRGPFELAGREAIKEVRKLVFMRRQEGGESSASSSPGSKEERLIKVPYQPTYSQSLTPDRTLLFHFSALSYNAHLIHLDERYSQEVEGRPGLLVHGPLCLNIMLEVLRRSCRQRELTVQRIDYRNLAPLYTGQKMTVCVRSPPNKELESGESEQRQHDVWIENQHGGLCVKGTVVATEYSMSKMERFHESFAKRMHSGEFD